MFEQLLQLVQEHTQEAVVQNQAIPNEHNEGVQQQIMQSIQQGLSHAAANGNMNDLLQLFSSETSSHTTQVNPIVSNIAGNLTQDLGSKFGLSSDISQQIISQVLPMVMSKFTGKVADPNDTSIDLNGVMQALTGGKSAGTNFNDMLSNVMKGGGGGLLDTLSGFLKH